MNKEQPSWKLRRRAVFSSLLFGFALIAYIAILGESTSLNETLALGAFGLVGAVIAAYIGGAAYEDVKLWRPMSLQDKQNQLYAAEDQESFDDDLLEDDFDDTIDDQESERNQNVH